MKSSGNKNKSPVAVHGEGDDLSGVARAVEQIGGAGGGVYWRPFLDLHRWSGGFFLGGAVVRWVNPIGPLVVLE